MECKLPKIDQKKRHQYKRRNAKEFYEYVRKNNLSGQIGEVWVWSAIDPESKYLFPDVIGEKTRKAGRKMMKIIKSRRANSSEKLLIQTDGFELYKELILECFTNKINKMIKRRGEIVVLEAEIPENILYTMLQKKRDSLGNIEDIDIKIVFGKESHILNILNAHNPYQGINTSYIERSNLNRRLFNARLRRKSLCFSKDYTCLVAQLNLQRIYANFCWTHHTLTKQFGRPTSPAMAIGKTNRIWTLRDIFFYPVS